VPTYDYRCGKCRHRFEEVQTFSSEPVATCPNCGGNAARQFSVPVVVYKGSGFYTTDHGRSSSGGNGQSKKSDGEAPSPSAKPKAEPKATPAAPSAKSGDK
jgi:putative FmdB family regulatory protein